MAKLFDKISERLNKVRKSPYVFFWVVFGVFLIFDLFFIDDNLIRCIKAEIENAVQLREIDRYRREIDDLDRRIRMLSNNRDTLEEYARENFYFSAPDEDVYIYEE